MTPQCLRQQCSAVAEAGCGSLKHLAAFADRVSHSLQQRAGMQVRDSRAPSQGILSPKGTVLKITCAICEGGRVVPNASFVLPS